MSELRAQVAEAVRARRMRKANTRTNQKYLKMSRTTWSIHYKICDEEKAIRKREKEIKTWPRNRKRSKRRKKNKGSTRKTRRKQQRKEPHIIDEMLEYQSETDIDLE